MTLVAERRTTYAFGRFTIDCEDERLFDTYGPIRIGHKAYQVLLKLIEQRGRLVTKDALMSSVWDGTIVTESALTSVIKELRRALGDDARTPHYIESVYGRGYRLLCGVVESDQSPDRSAAPGHARVGAAPPRPAALAPFAPVPRQENAVGIAPAAALTIAGPARSLATGRRPMQRAMTAVIATSILAMLPTGLSLDVDHVAAAPTAR